MKKAKKKKEPTNVATLRRATFVNRILAGDTQTDAARKAGYTGTPEALRVTACRLMAHPEVSDALKEQHDEDERRFQSKRNKIIERLLEQAAGEIGEYFEFNEYGHWTGIDLKRLKKDRKMYLLDGIESTKFGLKYKFATMHGAVDRLAKMLGWFPQEGKGGDTHIYAADHLVQVIHEYRNGTGDKAKRRAAGP